MTRVQRLSLSHPPVTCEVHHHKSLPCLCQLTLKLFVTSDGSANLPWTQAPGSVSSPHQSSFSLLSFSPVHSVSSLLLLLPPSLLLRVSFAAGNVGEVEGEGEGEDKAPAVSGSFWVPRLCGGVCGVGMLVEGEE